MQRAGLVDILIWPAPCFGTYHSTTVIKFAVITITLQPWAPRRSRDRSFVTMAWSKMSALVAVLIFAVPLTRGLASANGCSIQYQPALMRPMANALLECGLSGSVRWWRSSGPCGEFSEINCNPGLCDVSFNESINGNFYYCCTASSVTDGTSVLSLSDTERDCHRIQVCTDVSMNIQGAVTAFFNEPVQIFITMISEPSPSQNITTLLTQGRTQELDNVTFEYGYRKSIGAEWVWQYVVQVNDIDEAVDSGVLAFTVDYEHENSSCQQILPQHLNYQIPVRRRVGASPPAVSECTCTEPGMTQDPFTTSSGCSRDSAVIGLSVTVGILFLCLLFTLPVLLVFCVYIFRRIRRSSIPSGYDSPHDSSSSAYGIGNLFNNRPDYGRVNSTASTTTNTPLTATTPLSLLQHDPNHPLTQVARGELQNGTATNQLNSPENGSPNTHCQTTPTLPPPYPGRTLPELPVNSGAHGGTPMTTIHEEQEERPVNPGPVYEHVNNNVPLQSEVTDSSPVMV